MRWRVMHAFDIHFVAIKFVSAVVNYTFLISFHPRRSKCAFIVRRVKAREAFNTAHAIFDVKFIQVARESRTRLLTNTMYFLCGEGLF